MHLEGAYSPRLVLFHSTIAFLTQSSSRGYPFPVADKNTLKECNFLWFVDTHKHLHIQIRSKAQLETGSETCACHGCIRTVVLFICRTWNTYEG